MSELMRLEPLVGDWDVTLTHAWFLESLDTEIHGTASAEWYADAFLLLHGEFPGRTPEEGGSAWSMAFARNDSRDTFVALYHDDRGVSRVFDMTYDGAEWTLLREDPDFHQRIVMRLADDRLDWRGSVGRRGPDLAQGSRLHLHTPRRRPVVGPRARSNAHRSTSSTIGRTQGRTSDAGAYSTSPNFAAGAARFSQPRVDLTSGGKRAA